MSWQATRTPPSRGACSATLWLAAHKPDILCVQEIKAQQADMTAEILAPTGYHGHFHYAQKKGYGGVGLYSRQKPAKVAIGFGVPEFDAVKSRPTRSET